MTEATTRPGAPLLAGAGLHTFYGMSHILHGVGFFVAPRETIGMMGGNGMGKTTLLRSLLGLTRTQAGRVTLRARDVTQAAPHEIARAGVAYVPEGRGIFPNLTVRENLTMAARPGTDGRNNWTFERVLH